MTQTLFTGKHSDSLHWDAGKQNEALATMKSLRIRPQNIRLGYCHVSYEAYAKLRQAGVVSHQMLEE